MPGTFSPAFFMLEVTLRELSLFIGESGSDGLKDRYYLLALVLHEQDMDISENIRAYERSLLERGLPDIPFQASPLAKDAIIYKPASPADYRLSQIADYICTMELTALKYADKASTVTDEKFFGSWSQFKKGILKEVRAKGV